MEVFEEPSTSSTQWNSRPKEQSPNLGLDSYYVGQDLKSSVVHLKTLEARLSTLELKERQILQKTEEAVQRQRRRQEVKDKHRKVKLNIGV
jgi:hypothetical protein